jgi:beta-phosphoglucomutase-like phosphatase (HAD superfamily)
LGLDPRSCLAIEDSCDGWRAAKDAGMQVAVLGDQTPEWLDTEAELMRRLDASEVLRRLKRTAARR